MTREQLLLFECKKALLLCMSRSMPNHEIASLINRIEETLNPALIKDAKNIHSEVQTDCTD